MSEDRRPSHAGSEEALCSIEVDEDVFSRDVVTRAAYWFTDRYSVEVSRTSDRRLAVFLRAKNPNARGDRLKEDFRNALIDAQLRSRIADETAQIRTLIVAKAFAEGELLDDAPPGDWRDPVEIRDARPTKRAN